MIKLVNSDAVTIPLGDGVVNLVVTSPPYWNLRDYGVAGQFGLESTPDCGRPSVELRPDLTEKEREYVMSELKELGLI